MVKQEEETLRALQTLEKAVDQKIKALDAVMDEDERSLAIHRRKALQEQAEQRALWQRLGRGTLGEVTDQTEWFAEVKANDRVVCHFYRPSTERCPMLDAHLTVLARLHPETRFIKINVEKAPYLCQRLLVTLIPTLVTTKSNFSDAKLEGFDMLGARDDFTTRDLENWLVANGAVDTGEPAPDTVPGTATPRTRVQRTSVVMRSRGATLVEHAHDSDEDW